MVSVILKIAVIFLLCSTLLLLIRFRHQKFSGDSPSSYTTLIFILFTSGLDGGFILMPLIDFSQFKVISQGDYEFTNHLVIELGFWGVSVWLLYYVSTLYFLILEPKYKLFEIPWVKTVNSMFIIITCAFTLSVFYQCILYYLPQYFTLNLKLGISLLMLLVIVIFALAMSTKVTFMTRLSQVSMTFFALLTAYICWESTFDSSALLTSLTLSMEYLSLLPVFFLPINEYHEFYVAWWFSWTIMLGQFVAKFVNQLTPFSILVAMIILPLIPTFIWFAILFHWSQEQIAMTLPVSVTMILVATLFVVNSLDFMVRNYSYSLKLNIERLGKNKFLCVNTFILLGTTYLFNDKIFYIQWVAVGIIFMMFLLVAIIVFRHKNYINDNKKAPI